MNTAKLFDRLEDLQRLIDAITNALPGVGDVAMDETNTARLSVAVLNLRRVTDLSKEMERQIVDALLDFPTTELNVPQ